MPKWGVLKGGKEAENYWNGRLVEALHKAGVPSAGFERIFTVRKEGKEAQSKPDVSLANGGVHIVSGKFGARKELEAYRSADEYKEDIGPALKRIGEKLGEVFAVTYPSSKSEKYHLHVLPREGHQELSFSLETIDEVAEKIAITVKGLIAELERRQEPVLDEARRLLRWGAEDLATALKGVSLTKLETIFGGHDFFQSLLRPRLKGEKRAYALRLGAAYLFVNQVLFYVLLSEAAERAGNDERGLYPRIKPEHFSLPRILHDTYFERVRSKNYESIYGFDAAQFFEGDAAGDACESLVRGISGLAPKLAVPDLMGQIFQTLIPLEIRKPLGAHYTNPRAAALLARLAIRTSGDTVLDPACGSGTLLVAAYRRKRDLAGEVDSKDLHHKFVENEITGIDAMGFVAHLAAVNLAVQQPLVETDHVRIGTADSTSKRPGEDLMPTEGSLPREFQQASLEHAFDIRKPGKRKGAVQTSRKGVKSFRLESVDLVIMNPPFTSWDNMGESYRDALKKSFAQERADYRDAIHWKTSQQAFFLLLADRFLKPDGRIAAVLPVTTFTGVAFAPLLQYLLSRYSVRYIIVGLGRSSFSEDTSLTECLVVLEKGSPPPNHRFRLVGTITPPEELTDDDIIIAVEAAESGSSVEDRVLVRDHPQEALLPEGETLPGLILRLVPEFAKARTSIDNVLARTPLRMTTLENCLGPNGELKTARWVLGGGWLVYFGSMALFGYRSAERAVKQSDRLVFAGNDEKEIVFKDKVGGHEYRFPASHVPPSLRRFSFLPSPDATHESDFVIATPSAALGATLEAFYGAKEAKKLLSRIKEKRVNWRGGRWPALVQKGLTKVCMAGRLNLAAPGTTVLACRSDEPMLLAAYGFMVRGFRSDQEEKLFVLWLNSTIALLYLLDHITITEGTWVRMEQYVLNRLPMPDFSALTEAQWHQVEALYEKARSGRLPSLVDQLRDHSIREEIDEGLLALLGVRREESASLGRAMRVGALAAINLLAGTMQHGKGSTGPTEEENSDVFP